MLVYLKPFNYYYYYYYYSRCCSHLLGRYSSECKLLINFVLSNTKFVILFVHKYINYYYCYYSYLIYNQFLFISYFINKVLKTNSFLKHNIFYFTTIKSNCFAATLAAAICTSKYSKGGIDLIISDNYSCVIKSSDSSDRKNKANQSSNIFDQEQEEECLNNNYESFESFNKHASLIDENSIQIRLPVLGIDILSAYGEIT